MKLVPDFADILPVIVVATLAAAVLAFALTPLVGRLARRLDVVDRPDHRRVNTSPIPRGGGLAVAAAFLLVATAFVALTDSLELVRASDAVEASDLAALLLGGAAAALIGAADDYLQLRARWQLVGQIAVAVFAVALGINVGYVNNPVGPGVIRFDGVFAVVFTVLWIVGMINSINFIDGLDGLSSGIGLIAATTLGLISLTAAIGQPFVAVLCFTLAGALLGFLRWNFHPATIFVGTSGVMFIGYSLALLSILGTAKVAVALLVLGVPIIDTFWIIVRRIGSGRSPFTPDRGHIHHRMLDLGLSHRQTVLLIYAICVAFGVLTFVLSGTGQLYAFIGIVLLSGLALFVLTRRSLVVEELEAEAYEDEPAIDDDGAVAPVSIATAAVRPAAPAATPATRAPAPAPAVPPASGSGKEAP
jgi:UDP-GlcNAc:undecaprenyl-phosphate GlcNAc-1-phosphate transferase